MEPFTVYARMKKMGKQKRESLEPVPFQLKAKPENVRELLTGLVEVGVREFNEREDTGQILGCLTREEIAGKAETGKIAFGLRGGKDAVEEQAVENAIQSFEDGIYRVFAGESELTELEEKIPWEREPIFTFVRLTMISGW